jgi:hypothetical protein
MCRVFEMPNENSISLNCSLLALKKPQWLVQRTALKGLLQPNKHRVLEAFIIDILEVCIGRKSMLTLLLSSHVWQFSIIYICIYLKGGAVTGWNST